MVTPCNGAFEETAQPRRITLDLPRDPQAPAVARAAITGMLAESDISGSDYGTLMLLVSEVVTNAVRHSRAPSGRSIELSVSQTADVIRVAVADGGPVFTPKKPTPSPGRGGYGLYLLDRAAGSWGVQNRGGTCVWFELELS